MHSTLQHLAEETHGFTGSEIEEVVVSGLYTAFSDEHPLIASDLEREVRGTVPLSVTMAEKIGASEDLGRNPNGQRQLTGVPVDADPGPIPPIPLQKEYSSTAPSPPTRLNALGHVVPGRVHEGGHRRGPRGRP